MEQFVLVSASVHNKRLITQSVKNQEHPKYQLLQNSAYQIYLLKKVINKKLSAEADSLVDKILSCPRIKLSNSQTSFLDVVEIGVFLKHFAQELRRKNRAVVDI